MMSRIELEDEANRLREEKRALMEALRIASGAIRASVALFSDENKKKASILPDRIDALLSKVAQ